MEELKGRKDLFCASSEDEIKVSVLGELPEVQSHLCKERILKVGGAR